jgi:hypothetical protein
MGRPIHYSLDIVTRCRRLLAELMPVVQMGLVEDSQFGGPLSTTFAPGVANPIIGLPIEQIGDLSRPMLGGRAL